MFETESPASGGDSQSETEQPTTTPAAESSAGTQKTVPPPKDEPAPVPYQRFKEVNDELATLRDNAAKAARDKKSADDKALADQNKWQELAQSREKEIADLQPKIVVAERLTVIVAKQLDEEVKTWPDSVRKIMPAADAPLIDRLEWAERTRPLAQELLDAQNKNKGTRFPQQHSGNQQNQTTKDVAQGVLQRNYRRKKDG